MQRRFQDAVAKGCQGIDPDNMNGWSVDTGFEISFNDQLIYNQAIAREVRRLGIAFNYQVSTKLTIINFNTPKARHVSGPKK